MIPHLPPDDDVPLMLQPAVDACFELVGYHEYLLDYDQPPPQPPFDPDDAGWIETVIQAYSDEKVTPND